MRTRAGPQLRPAPPVGTAAALLLVAWAARAPAQDATRHASDPGRASEVVGTVSFENSGAPEAQAAFLYGLAQLHNFEYGAAGEAFRRAREIDPGFVMAYWGEAMSHNHPVWMEQDSASARAVLAELGPDAASRLARAPTERERAWLRALEVLYGDGDKEGRDDAYAEAMRGLYESYPDEPNAAAFYALSLLGTAHEGRDFPTYMKAAAVLEGLAAEHPGHPGLAHYAIHSYDDPIHAPLGLRAAQAYAHIAPDAAHAQHMTSHIFVALGMWPEVVRANENAVAVVDRERAARGTGASACGHYNYWLEYGYLQSGRTRDAERLVQECFARVRAETGPDTADPTAAPVGSFARMRARYVIDSGDWGAGVLRLSPDLEDRPHAALTYAFATGFAAARDGDVAAARDALSRLVDARREVELRLAEEGAADTELGGRPGVLELELRAVVAAAAGDADRALSLAREAARAEERIPFVFGPPFIDKPSHELLGELALEAGRPEEATTAFARAVERTPGRVQAVGGLEAARAAVAAAARRVVDPYRSPEY